MDFMNLVVFLIIGLVSGLLAGLILRGSGLGLVCDIVAGLAGGVLGGILMMTFGDPEQAKYLSWAAAAVGATVVIMLAGPIKRHL